MGLGSGSKTFLGLCTTICSTALKVKIFFDLAQFETFCVFWSFWAIFGVGFSFKNFFETCLYRQSTLVLEVQPYLSFFIWPHLWLPLHFFGPFVAISLALRGPLGLYLWSGSGWKTFFEPTYVDNQLWFWNCSPIFMFLIWPNLGPFIHFLGLSGLFLGLGSSSKTFLGPTYID